MWSNLIENCLNLRIGKTVGLNRGYPKMTRAPLAPAVLAICLLLGIQRLCALETPTDEELRRFIGFVWRDPKVSVEIRGTHVIEQVNLDTNAILSEVDQLAERVARETGGRLEKDEVRKLNYELRIKSARKTEKYKYQQSGEYTRIQKTWLENPIRATNLVEEFEEERILGPEGVSTTLHFQNEVRKNTDGHYIKMLEVNLILPDAEDLSWIKLAFRDPNTIATNMSQVLPEFNRLRETADGKDPRVQLRFSRTNIAGNSYHEYSFRAAISNEFVQSFSFLIDAKYYRYLAKYSTPLGENSLEATSFFGDGCPKTWRGTHRNSSNGKQTRMSGEFLAVRWDPEFDSSIFRPVVPTNYSVLEAVGNQVFEVKGGVRTLLGNATEARHWSVRDLSAKWIAVLFVVLNASAFYLLYRSFRQSPKRS